MEHIWFISEFTQDCLLFILIAILCEKQSLKNGTEEYHESIRGGNSTVEGVPYGTVATYSCEHGLALMGSTTRTCQITGNWNETLPSCERKAMMKCIPRSAFNSKMCTICIYKQQNVRGCMS